MKKILGVIFLVVGVLFTLSLLAQIPPLVGIISKGASDGFVIGSLTAFALISYVTYLLFKFGLRWIELKTDRTRINTLDEDLRQTERNTYE